MVSICHRAHWSRRLRWCFVGSGSGVEQAASMSGSCAYSSARSSAARSAGDGGGPLCAISPGGRRAWTSVCPCSSRMSGSRVTCAGRRSRGF